MGCSTRSPSIRRTKDANLDYSGKLTLQVLLWIHFLISWYITQMGHLNKLKFTNMINHWRHMQQMTNSMASKMFTYMNTMLFCEVLDRETNLIDVNPRFTNSYCVVKRFLGQSDYILYLRSWGFVKSSIDQTKICISMITIEISCYI